MGSRGRAPLVSSFPREILGNEKFRDFLSRHKKLDPVQQSLLTLIAVADDVESKLLATADRSASSSRNVAEWLCNLQDTMCRLQEISLVGDHRKIDFIIGRFETITKQKVLLLQTEKLRAGEQESTPPDRNLSVYGRDREKDEVVDFLLSGGGRGKTSVIAIVGVEGIGKTTLADLVYRDDRVKASFDLQGWAEFRQGLDAESLAKTILDSFNKEFCYGDGLTELMLRLRECLKGNRFLLVLDGFIRNLAGWETLFRTCFAADYSDGRGSVIILTTPKVEVASEMLSDHVLHLGSLSLQDSCYLFLEHAFGEKDPPDLSPQLASLTKQIVRKLGGLPLAVKKLGSLLYDHRDFHVWTELLKIKRSDLLDLNLLPLQLPSSSPSCLYHFEDLVHLEIVGARISELPNQIETLACLQHLDLSFSDIRALPDSMSVLSRLQTLKLSFCRYLRKLPSSLVGLVNLHYLDIRGTCQLETSFQLGRLMKNLQMLIGFVVNRESGSNLKELANVPNIRTLSITGLQHMVDATHASEANLKEKTSLENLVLRWNQTLVAECKQAVEDLGVPQCEQALEHLEPPKQLKVIELSGCPVSRFPYWLGDASFATLEVLYLRDCKICCFLPPLGQLPSLKELYIQGCDNVRSVGNEFYGETNSHAPFKSLEILWFVDMPYWTEWIHLDPESLQFPCLRELFLIHCPQLLQDLPKHLPSLKKLEISECNHLVALRPKILDNHEMVVQEQNCNEILATSVAEVTLESSSMHATSEGGKIITMTHATNSRFDELISDDGDGDDDDNDNDGEASHSQDMLDFKSFEIVKVKDASELCSLPKGLKSLKIEGCQFLESLPNWLLSGCGDILELLFIDCCSLKHFAEVLQSDSLRTLYIHKCRKLEFHIPLGVHKKFTLLEHLCISSSCESLTSIAINLFPRLRTLYIKDCLNLGSFLIAEGLRDRNLKLESLEIRDCPNLISFPNKGLPTSKLKSVSISNCRSLKSLPNNLATLTSLQSLLIDKCPELESFPGGGLPSSLSLLSIAFSDKLAPHKEWKLHMLPSLTHFEIDGGCIGMKAFPDKIILPRNLKSLRISNLSSLTVLNGKGLQHLTALETLEINYCHRLYSLPEEGLPSSLTCLCIKESSILTQKLLYKAGVEWSKIAHIPNLQIDDGAVYGAKKEGVIRGQKQKFRERKFVTRPTDLEAWLEGENDNSDEKSHISQQLEGGNDNSGEKSQISQQQLEGKMGCSDEKSHIIQELEGEKGNSDEKSHISQELEGEKDNLDEKSHITQQQDQDQDDEVPLSSSTSAFGRPYTHLPSSTGPSGSIQKDRSFPERPGEPECQYYLKTGYCSFGLACQFHHPRPYTPLPSSTCPLGSIQKDRSFPERPGEPECQYYLETGDCKYGLTCRWHHPQDLGGKTMRTSLDLSHKCHGTRMSTDKNPIQDESHSPDSDSNNNNQGLFDELSDYLNILDDVHDPPESLVSGHVLTQANNEVSDSGTSDSNSHLEGFRSAMIASELSKKKGVREIVAFRNKSEVEILDDGFRWRKYGKGMVKDRNYYSCLVEGCPVKKRVERDTDDPSYVITTYQGTHSHPISY